MITHNKTLLILCCSVMLLGCGGGDSEPEEKTPEKKNVYAGALDKAKGLQSDTDAYNNRLTQLQNEIDGDPVASANALLKSAMSRASNGKKMILLYFTAPSCADCPHLEKFFNTNRQVLSKDYVLQPIDFQRTPGAADLMKHYGGKGDRSSLPWMAILDAKGFRKASSDGPQGNIGLPRQPDQREHFLKMLRSTGSNITSDEYLALDEALKGLAKPNAREVLGLPGNGPLRP